MEVDIAIISFDSQVIAASKQHLPNLRAMWLAAFDGKGDDPTAEEVLDTLRQCGANGLGSTSEIPVDLAAQVLAKCYHWHAWTVDDAAVARRLIERGAESITTNTPGKLRAELERA